MTYVVTSRWGVDDQDAPLGRMRAVLDELGAPDREHGSASLKHESEWCLSAYEGGKLVWQNVEEGNARHMNAVPLEKVVRLWLSLAEGDIIAVDAEPWLDGYG